MLKLTTIQKRENLNNVYPMDTKGHGGAHHVYSIYSNTDKEGELISQIKFQNGARNAEDSIKGVIDTDLLEIVRHRLQCFQRGDFATEYNQKALEHIELALMYMHRRVEDRIERGCIRNTDLKVPIELYSNIPLIGEWNSNYVLNGTDTEIRINKIYGLSWDKKAGVLLIHSNCDYYINEYHEDYKEPSKKPVLKVIK